MVAARAPRRWATTRRRPGACRRSATAPARRASSPTATSSAGAAAVRRAAADVSFIQEGAVGRGPADGPHRVHERLQLQDDDPYLVARIDDLPGDGRPHDRRPRRAQARARVRRRGDGRPQAGRVRADAHLSRARFQGPGAMTPDNPQDPQKGKVDETTGKVADEAQATKAPAGAETAAQPEPTPTPTDAERAEPEAEGQAAAETGVDKT